MFRRHIRKQDGDCLALEQSSSGKMTSYIMSRYDIKRYNLDVQNCGNMSGAINIMLRPNENLYLGKMK
jgi:hypothetical protein